MKRPLCLLAILVTVAVVFYLNIFTSVNTDNTGVADMSHVELYGKVQNKELKKIYTGEMISVIYLVPLEKEKKDFEMVQCYLDPSSEIVPSIGQFVLVSGKVKVFSKPTNPGEFDSHLYYSTLKISYRINDAKVLKLGGSSDPYREKLYNVKLYFEQVLDRVLKEQDSAIMKAMLLGDKVYLDEETKEMYKNSGGAHLLAISGLHISLIGMGLYELLKRIMLITAQALAVFWKRIFTGKNNTALGNRLSRYLTIMVMIMPAFIAVFFMISYGIMCGMGTSSFRAICMFMLRLMAPIAGRSYDVLSSLALAEILLLLDQPLYLLNSGFLFSFGAVFGITVVKPVFCPMTSAGSDNKMRFADDNKRQGVIKRSFINLTLKARDGLQTGLSIAIVTLPVYSVYYFTYPVHSVILNLILIPLMGSLMMAGVSAMFLGALSDILGFIPGIIVHVILLFQKVISSSEEVNGRFTWYMGHSGKIQVMFYIVCLFAFLAMAYGPKNRPTKLKDKKAARIVQLKGMPDIFKDSKMISELLRYGILLLGIVVLTFHKSPDMEISLLDVGQGDGIVVSSAGHNILIDGGSTTRKNVGKYQIIPFLKYKAIGTLDAAIVTHEDEDHISGLLEIMDDMEKGGIRVRKLILPEIAEDSRGENYHLLMRRAAELGIPVLYINKGESFNIGNATFTCLNPALGMGASGANEYSTVLFMEYKNFTALFTGDVEGEGQEYLKSVIRSNPNRYANLSLLKVAHHGSRYTTDSEFLELVHPKAALISCGLNNTYGHPHGELLERLGAMGTVIYRTDQGGCIAVTVEKTGIKVSKYIKTMPEQIVPASVP